MKNTLRRFAVHTIAWMLIGFLLGPTVSIQAQSAENAVVFIRHGKAQKQAPYNLAPGSWKAVCASVQQTWPEWDGDLCTVEPMLLSIYYAKDNREPDSDRFRASARAVQWGFYAADPNSRCGFSRDKTFFYEVPFENASNPTNFELASLLSLVKSWGDTKAVRVFVMSRQVLIKLSEMPGFPEGMKQLKQEFLNGDSDYFYAHYWPVDRDGLKVEEVFTEPISYNHVVKPNQLCFE